MINIAKNTILYRMDYHISNEAYKVISYDQRTGFGEIVRNEDPDCIYIFSDRSIKDGTLCYSPEEALKTYNRYRS